MTLTIKRGQNQNKSSTNNYKDSSWPTTSICLSSSRKPLEYYRNWFGLKCLSIEIPGSGQLQKLSIIQKNPKKPTPTTAHLSALSLSQQLACFVSRWRMSCYTTVATMSSVTLGAPPINHRILSWKG